MKKDITYYISSLVFTVLFLLFATYLRSGTTANYEEAMAFYNFKNTINIVELNDGIKLINAYPVQDKIGITYEGYKFKIDVSSNIEEEYTFKFINTLDESYEALEYSNLRYQVIKNNEELVSPKQLSMDGILFTDTVKDEDTYEIKLWIKYDAKTDILGKYFSSKIALM